MTRYVSLCTLGLLILAMGLAFLKVLFPYLLPLMLAGVVAMLVQPYHQRVVRRTGNRQVVAASISTSVLLFVFFGPLVLGTLVGAWQLLNWSTELYAAPQTQQVLDKSYRQLQIQKLIRRVQPYVAPEMTPEDLEARLTENVQQNFPKWIGTIAERTLGLTGATLGLIGAILPILAAISIFSLALFYFFLDGHSLLETAQELFPLDRKRQDELLREFQVVTRAVVIGTVLSALAQGVATGLGLWFMNFPHVILLTILATVAAIIPLAGAWLVWGPCLLWMMVAGQNSVAAMSIFGVYCLLVVSSLDNIIRTYILNSDVRLHPLLALISILGGLQWLGLWGVLIGPIVAACFYALIRSFQQELSSIAKSLKSPATGISQPAVQVIVTAPAERNPGAANSSTDQSSAEQASLPQSQAALTEQSLSTSGGTALPKRGRARSGRGHRRR